MPNWSPIGFDRYRERFPATPSLPALRANITTDFSREWSGARTAGSAAADVAPSGPRRPGLTCVLVRGLFGTWIPRHFVEPLRALHAAGYAAIIAKTPATGTIGTNAELLRHDLEARAPEGSLMFLCHSKGGLDVLAMLAAAPELRARTVGVALCQTPRAGCAVLESVLLGAHRDSAGAAQRVKERTAHAAIALAGARAACLELTSPALQESAHRLSLTAERLPVVSVASWSSQPTAWLDSQHARLAAIRPGCAHDGLFYLEDLVWPAGRQVLLPQLDHAQMCVGGGDFDHGRFWVALATLLLPR